ncbi:hypothetical protein JHK82_042347 [Glycine max]|uniref:Reverse transcriptase zinc-binding domain-containing protein n=1 Tax=Glycine max TaxID=3847 RepID=A0A0R0GC04_SOYBN|nr:hypothetical protein JHK87_042302 [Glycine soja]KAG4949151.1 hypothetical protein JHK86_042390 [Glycine max]KAG5105377.1 hypothetical protein JHK82_042347 [Glycine max]KAG5116505.1 hypothetical protein JHK84_042618 [Glycine max]KAH1147208.1 hypothetical protein GYH30_042397 [Glycine max]
MNLLKRGIPLQDQELLCMFCNNVIEDTSHIFFSCVESHHFLKWWHHLAGLSSALPHIAKEHFWQHSHELLNGKFKRWWMVGWCAIVWNIWV